MDNRVSIRPTTSFQMESTRCMLVTQWSILIFTILIELLNAVMRCFRVSPTSQEDNCRFSSHRVKYSYFDLTETAPFPAFRKRLNVFPSISFAATPSKGFSSSFVWTHIVHKMCVQKSHPQKICTHICMALAKSILENFPVIFPFFFYRVAISLCAWHLELNTSLCFM